MNEHTFHALGAHTYWLSPDSTTDRPVLGVVAGTRASLVVDAGNGPAHADILLRAVSTSRLAAPRYAVLTHWHWDHVFGTAALDLPTCAHYETQRIVQRMAQFDWSDAALDQRVADGTEIAFCRDMIKAELPDRSTLTIRPPNIGFATEMRLDLGGVTAHLVHVGGDHAPDSSVVYVPEDRVLFLGDCIYDDLHHGARRLTTTHVFPLLDRLVAYDAACYVPAHHDAPLTRAAFAAEASLLRMIGRTVQAYGDNRAAVLAALPAILDTPLTDEHAEITDAFLAGLRLPEVTSVL